MKEIYMKYVFIAVAAVLCAFFGSCLSFSQVKDVDTRGVNARDVNAVDANLINLSIDELAVRIEKEPRNDALYRMRAAKYGETGRFLEALIDAKRAIEISPRNSENWRARGWIYFIIGRYEQSIGDFMHALDLSPGAETYIGLFSCYVMTQEWDKALVCADKLIELNPDDYGIYIERAIVFSRLNDMPKAMADLNKAAELNPDNKVVFLRRAELYLNEGEYEKALSDFDAAIRLDANYAYAWYGRAISHFRIGNYQRSIDDMTVYISLVPEPEWKAVEGRGTAYQGLAGQTKDEKQKAEYLKKAEADSAWSRELSWKQQIVGQK
jgi:tetratricopeptide (TPR) repeat protein